MRRWWDNFAPEVRGLSGRVGVELELLFWRIAEPDGYRRPRADWLRRRVITRISGWLGNS